MTYESRNRTLPSFEAVPDIYFLTFSKEDVKDAALTCSTDIKVNMFDFGFTAGNTFFKSESLVVHDLKFYHDQRKIDIEAYFKTGEKVKMEFKYSSFCKLSFELSKKDENVNAKLLINITHPPLFWAEKRQKGNWMKFVRVDPKEYDKNFWEQFIQSRAFRLSFNLKISEMYSFMNQLYQNVLCVVTFVPMKEAVFDSIRLQDLDKLTKKWDWNIQYDVECIKRCGTQGSYFLDYVLFEKRRIVDLQENIARDLFASMYDHLRMDLSLSSLDFQESGRDKERNLGENFVLVKTVYVTPTRTILTREDWTMDSRGLRYIGVGNLVQIKFRDENLSWFPYELADHIITPTCRSGIIIADKLFFEFGGSSSLFRECGTYFCNAKSRREVLTMYKELGEFEPSTAAKMAARLGQYFTSAWKLRLQLRQSSVCLIDDILSTTVDSAGNHYCFTDGVGIMSYIFAAHISRELGIPYVPSAFQIRYVGYKGMLIVAPKDSKNLGGDYYPKLIDNDGQYCALFRKSQKKFHVESEELFDFDIVQWSAPAPFNLYRTFIGILDYLAYKDGKQQIIRDRLRELNNAACYDIIKPLIHNQAFLDKLEKLPTYCPISKMEMKNLSNEPFWRSMVEASVLEDAKMLANKTQLPLPANFGRTAYGIADYTGKLKKNEIFFQYSTNLSAKNCTKNLIVLKGRVGVTRSPIFHPGDIRFLTAVDIPELRHLVNVVVFPTVGDRPVPDEIGGGDLDGDAYGIFWDKALLLDKNVPASDFADHDSCNAKKINIDELQEKHPEFRAEYQKNRNIEPLSNSYLAILLTHDPESDECKSMRKCADSAVNYPKSGIFGRALKDDERHNFWPEFMCKDHEPAFKTTHMLCELHEKSNAWYQQIRIATKEAEKLRSAKAFTTTTTTDPVLQRYFENFKNEIKKIMIKHQIQTEGELYANAFNNTCGALSTVKMPLINESSETSIVQKQVHHIFKKYRSKLLYIFSNTWKADMESKKESILTYKYPNGNEMIRAAKNMYALAEEDNSCKAFPWLLWEGLDAWWKNEPEQRHNFTIAKKLEIDCHDHENTSLLFSNLPGLSSIRTALERKGVQIDLCGTFSQMCRSWILSVELNGSIYGRHFQTFLFDFLTKIANEEIPVVKSSGEVFLAFLISEVQKKSEDYDSNVLHKAVQATLIRLSFLPEIDIFDEFNFEQYIIEQQCIVISVPKNWAAEFEEKYKLLQEDSGCQDVAIGFRRSFKDLMNYSVMFRGTLESCQKLKTMLTPLITVRLSNSMKDTKKHIADEMNNVLMGIFDFQQPLNHSMSAANRLNNDGSSSRSSRRKWNKNKKVRKSNTLPQPFNN